MDEDEAISISVVFRGMVVQPRGRSGRAGLSGRTSDGGTIERTDVDV